MNRTLPMPTPRRSIFADRLAEYADFAFGDAAVFARRGHWAAFFSDRIGPTFDGRIVFEIGCHDGDLLARMAAKHPTTAFVGLDWKAKSVYDAAGRVAALGLRNVALLRGRGQDLARVFGPGEVNEILLFHPDPCHLPAERPNRLFNEPFLLDAHGVLRDAASSLTLKTDHPGYYGWALAVLGLDEPVCFAYARRRATADPMSASRRIGNPRVRAADLLAFSDRPPRSASSVARFAVAAASVDLWHDPAVLAAAESRVFAGERTGFEARFVGKRQPIFFLEVRKRPTP